jgi:hypothetical protein
LGNCNNPGAVSRNLVEPGSTPSRLPVSIVLSIATLLPAVPALTLQPLARGLIAARPDADPGAALRGQQGQAQRREQTSDRPTSAVS